MIYILDNVLAILAATAAGLLLGALYRFAGPGRPGAGAPPLGPGIVLLAALAEFWLAAILAGALILAPKEAGPWTMAIGSGVVIWIGFVAPALLVTGTVRGEPLQVTLGDCAYWLVTMATQAAVLQAIGLRAPG